MRSQAANVIQDALNTFQARLRASFMLRWVLANMIGWSLGLFLGTPAVCLGGVLTGLCLGVAQWWALKLPHPPPLPASEDGSKTMLIDPQLLKESDDKLADAEGAEDIEHVPVTVARNWIGVTAAGVIVGGLPAFGMSLLVALGWGLGTAVVGGIFGAGVGIAQYFILQRGMNRAAWWIGANVAGGAVCALFTLAPLIRGLPIGLLLGTAIYGYITGRALLWLTESHQ